MRIYVGVLCTRKDMLERDTETFGHRLLDRGIPEHIHIDLEGKTHLPWWISVQIKMGELKIGPGLMEFMEPAYEIPLSIKHSV